MVKKKHLREEIKEIVMYLVAYQTPLTLMGHISLECEQLWPSKTSYPLQVLVMFIFLTSLPLSVLPSIHTRLSGRWPVAFPCRFCL